MKINTAGPNLGAILSRFDKRLQQLKTSKQLLVGVPASAGTEKDGMPLARLAYIHEFGATIDHPNGAKIIIPERSFLRAPLKANLPKYRKAFEWFVSRALDSQITMDQALSQAGLMMVRDCQEAISQGIGPPLARSTIARKGSSKPLIDTGRLRQAITYQVTDDEE